MTKRLKSKHKVDQDLKRIFGADQKVRLILGHILQVNTDKIKKVSQPITEFNYKQNKN